MEVWGVGRALCLSCLIGYFPGCAIAAITIDGELSESEWSQAHLYSAFRTTQPLTFDEPDYPTRAHIAATFEGLAVAIQCVQPHELRVRGRSPRDSPVMSADTVSIIVDFEGTGSTAFEFAVSLSGSVRDGMILQQNRFQYPWDGIWYSAVHETDVGWTVEVLLPWSIAPLGPIKDGQRTIGVLISRDLRARAQRFAFPPLPVQSPSLVADLQKVQVAAFDNSLLAFTPYGAVHRDLLTTSTEGRGGADLIWRPTTAQQLSATLLPDFGQVESDDLVVNFTAVETLLADKRPFFTENQQLFDVRLAQDDRLINTRRIGAVPDAGMESSSDVLGALKYFWTGSNWEVGGFAAVEDDSDLAQGRAFAAGRLQRRVGAWSLGYLGTYVDRPTLNRQVAVHSADAAWTPATGWRLSGQVVTARPSQFVENGRSSQSGYGALMKLEYAGTAPLTQTLYLAWYDEEYDTNDMGFLERNSLREIRSQTSWYYRRRYPQTSRLLETQWLIDARMRMNQREERLQSSFQIGPFWKYRDGSSLLVYVKPIVSGIDDLSSRGNGSFKLPAQGEARASYLSSPSRAFQYFWYLKILREGLEDYGWEVQLQPSWLPTENLKLAMTGTYRESPDWLIWRPEPARMTQHERRLLQTALSAEWFPTPRTEVRARLQWAGLQAQSVAAYEIDAHQNLIRSDGPPPPDFGQSELAFQVRFRFQFRPLSDLYIAYNFGGLAHESDDERFGHLWSAALGSRTSHQFLVKLAYRL